MTTLKDAVEANCHNQGGPDHMPSCHLMDSTSTTHGFIEPAVMPEPTGLPKGVSRPVGTVSLSQATHDEDMPEKELQTIVERLLRAHGYKSYHVFDSRRSEAGWPDIVAIREGRILVIELKSEKGNVSKEQREWLDEWGKTSAEVWVWRPADLDSGVIEDAVK